MNRRLFTACLGTETLSPAVPCVIANHSANASAACLVTA